MQERRLPSVEDQFVMQRLLAVPGRHVVEVVVVTRAAGAHTDLVTLEGK